MRPFASVAPSALFILVACSSEDVTPLGLTGGGASGPSGSSTTTTTTGGGASGAAGGVVCDEPDAPLPKLELTAVAHADKPVFVTHAPGDPDRLYVIERPGRIRIVEDGVTLPQPFLDITELVSCCENDRALLGLAFHPGYAQNGRFYVHYTEKGSKGDNGTVLAEYARDPIDPDLAQPAFARVLQKIENPYQWHYGGWIGFGPDGLLYVPRGDGGSVGDPQNHAQYLQTKLGKILRIDVDTHPIPPEGNLPGADPDAWAMGLRNPWRSSFDRCTGDLWMGDVGQNDWEEVDVVPAGMPHLNFGWDHFEGTHCFEPPCEPRGLTMPVVEFQHTEGCAVIGGFVYRGSRIPGLRGSYLYGDICTGRIWSLVWSDGEIRRHVELSADLGSKSAIGDTGLSSFGEDAHGELYACDMVNGIVFRIDPE